MVSARSIRTRAARASFVKSRQTRKSNHILRMGVKHPAEDWIGGMIANIHAALAAGLGLRSSFIPSKPDLLTPGANILTYPSPTFTGNLDEG